MLKQPVRISLSDFIKTTMGSQFVIPVYQRNYTWNPEKETERFMNDIQALLEHRVGNHFLGIIIYIESKVSAMFRQLQVVDGQQRLTTSFIFLLALKKIAEEKRDKGTAGMISDYYLYNRHVSKEAALRLKPAVSNDDVYAKLVYGSERDLDASEKGGSVYRNYIFIRKRILELNAKHSLLEILDCLNHMDMLEFPLSDTDDAQQIFESINSTGAPLTSADMIRNYVLMNHTDDVQEHYYKMYWEPLERNFPESRKLEEFFRYYLAVKTYELYSRKDVYERFKGFWAQGNKDTETKLREINRYSRYYHEIYEGSAQDKEVEKALRDFRKSEYRMPAPFLMEMYSLHEEGVISASDLAAQVRMVDTYMMRRALCGNDNSALGRYFPSLLRAVMNLFRKNKGKDIVSITRICLVHYNKGKPLAMPPDDVIRKQMSEVNAYSLMCLRPVLDRIEHDGAHAAVDLSDLNIEHIMPRHPNNWWKKNSGAKDEDEYTFYANLIGNLTLCAEYDNTRMGNEDFAFKKRVLSSTNHIRMNTEILKKKSWTIEDIQKRCGEMADAIIRIYPYNMNGGAEKKSSKPVISHSDMIVLNAPTVNATALYHHNGDIEVLSGTTMKPYDNHAPKKHQILYKDLYDREILKETEDGKTQFETSCHFSSLNEAAQFLMHRGGDNASAWTYEDGSPLSEKPVPVLSNMKKPAAIKSKPATKKMAQLPMKSLVAVQPVIAKGKESIKSIKGKKEPGSAKVKKQAPVRNVTIRTFKRAKEK